MMTFISYSPKIMFLITTNTLCIIQCINVLVAYIIQSDNRFNFFVGSFCSRI